MPWIFEHYATGEWTVTMLRDELVKQGVTTLPKPKQPARPIAASHINAIIKNRYYVGVVTFEGIEYPGQHPALVSEKLFEDVQRVRKARHQSGEKPRVRSHYLRGSVYCGNCGEPLGFGQSRNRVGTLYDYFFCLGRQSLKNGCTFRAVQAHHLEDLVSDHWRTVALNPRQIEDVRALVLDHLNRVLPQDEAARRAAAEHTVQLDRDSQKVLDAFYADAIDTHELKREQARIASRRAALEKTLMDLELNEQLITRQLDNCLRLLAAPHAQYLGADNNERRDLNQAVFHRLYIHDDEIIASDLKPAFRRLLSDNLPNELASERKATRTVPVPTIAPASGLQHRHNENTGTGSLPSRARRTPPARRRGGVLTLERPKGRLPWETKEPRPSKDRGSDELLLVAGAGSEPATSGSVPLASSPLSAVATVCR